MHATYVRWPIVHVSLIVAITLWLLGLARLSQPPTATRLLMVALSLWMTNLVAELTIIPMLVSRLSGPSGRALVLGSAWFSFALRAGYLAMALVWLAVVLMAGQPSTPWLVYWERIGGVVGLLGNIYPVFVSIHALYVLAITADVPYVWTSLLADMHSFSTGFRQPWRSCKIGQG